MPKAIVAIGGGEIRTRGTAPIDREILPVAWFQSLAALFWGGVITNWSFAVVGAGLLAIRERGHKHLLLSTASQGFRTARTPVSIWEAAFCSMSCPTASIASVNDLVDAPVVQA
jgi:hypothetical protein